MTLKDLFDNKCVPVMHSTTFYDYISEIGTMITKIDHAGDAVVVKLNKSGDLPSVVIVTDFIEKINWNTELEFTSENKVGSV